MESFNHSGSLMILKWHAFCLDQGTASACFCFSLLLVFWLLAGTATTTRLAGLLDVLSPRSQRPRSWISLRERLLKRLLQTRFTFASLLRIRFT